MIEWFVRLWMSHGWCHDRLIHQLEQKGTGKNGWSHSHHIIPKHNSKLKVLLYVIYISWQVTTVLRHWTHITYVRTHICSYVGTCTNMHTKIAFFFLSHPITVILIKLYKLQSYCYSNSGKIPEILGILSSTEVERTFQVHCLLLPGRKAYRTEE